MGGDWVFRGGTWFSGAALGVGGSEADPWAGSGLGSEPWVEQGVFRGGTRGGGFRGRSMGIGWFMEGPWVGLGFQGLP